MWRVVVFNKKEMKQVNENWSVEKCFVRKQLVNKETGV